MKRRDSLPTSRTKKSPGSGIWSARPTFSQLRKKKRPSSSRKIASSQNEAPVSSVLAERCSPTPPRAGAFGIPTFSIFSAPVLPRFTWNFRSPKNLATDSESCPTADFLSTGSVLAARGASTFPSAVAEPFLFGPRIFRWPFLSFPVLAWGSPGKRFTGEGRSRFPYQLRGVSRRVAGEERRDERERHCPLCRGDPDDAPSPHGLAVAEDSLRARSLETAPSNSRWVALQPVPAPNDSLYARTPRHGQRSPRSTRLPSGLLCEVFLRVPGRPIPSGMRGMSDGPGNLSFPRSRLQARTCANLAQSVQASRDIVPNPKPSLSSASSPGQWPASPRPSADACTR